MKKQKNPNTLQVIATTPLQAQLLTEAGLSASTADMRWNRRATMFGQMILEPLAPSDPLIRYEGIPEHPADFIPAWSLGNLMRIADALPNLPDRPDLLIAGLVNYICEQLENGGGFLHNLNLGRSK
jgi:hypothetical protein